MVRCPKCGKTGTAKIIGKKEEIAWPGYDGPKKVTTEIRRECKNCHHRWSTNPHANWRWVYSSRIEKWVLIPPNDSRDDWKYYGIPQDEMKKVGKKKATEMWSNGTFIGIG